MTELSPIEAVGIGIQEAAAAQEFVEAAPGFAILVTEHAMWRAAERFPRFDTVLIEDEVRAALVAGRITTDRQPLGLARWSDPASLYVWTPEGERIYALRHDDQPPRFVVTTTLRRGQ